MNFETYEHLGGKYLPYNKQAAFLCYENALYHCENSGNAGDMEAGGARERILVKLRALCGQAGDGTGADVRKVSIVIVSYNSKYLMRKCVESIRKYCNPKTYELVVVDNASTDGVREWLCGQEDIKTVLVDENVGFPAGCNIGVSYAEPENDLFFLNNDTRLTPEALFFLRMGLYADERTGAAGCVANYCGNGQDIDVQFELPEDYIEYGRRRNVPCGNPFEEKNKLCGFAMLVKREAWNKTSGMDEAYSPGYFDDDDLSTQIRNAGYTLRVCHNSYIYHAGSQSFGGRSDVTDIIVRNYGYFVGKWEYDITYYSRINVAAIEAFGKFVENQQTGADRRLRVLELGAGCGCTLARLCYLFPDVEVCGIEENAQAVQYCAAGTNIAAGEGKEALRRLLEQGERFDCIIFSGTYGQGQAVWADQREEMRILAEALLKEKGILIGG